VHAILNGYPENTPGRYYVTEECNGCGLCATFAPDNFAWSADGSYCFVARQPADTLELDALWDAIQVCPMRCIEDDGASEA
jgi:ferredoxin